MAMSYVSFGTYFLFMCGKFGGINCVNNFTEFMQNDDLQDHTCSDIQTSFNDTDEGSLAYCVYKCSTTSGCYGVFHHAGRGHCVGCCDKFLKNDSAPPSKDTHFYSRPMDKNGVLQTYIFVLAVSTWNDAKEDCEDLGGHLADIKSPEEEQFIETYVLPGLGNGALIWIGATDVQIEGTFLWHDGTRVEDSFVNWGPYDPTNYPTEHCVVLQKTEDGWEWIDDICDSLYSSLCELD